MTAVSVAINSVLQKKKELDAALVASAGAVIRKSALDPDSVLTQQETSDLMAFMEAKGLDRDGINEMAALVHQGEAAKQTAERVCNDYKRMQEEWRPLGEELAKIEAEIDRLEERASELDIKRKDVRDARLSAQNTIDGYRAFVYANSAICRFTFDPVLEADVRKSM